MSIAHSVWYLVRRVAASYYKGMSEVGTSYVWITPEPEQPHEELPVGLSVMFANFENDVKIFAPKFKLFGAV